MDVWTIEVSEVNVNHNINRTMSISHSWCRVDAQAARSAMYPHAPKPTRHATQRHCTTPHHSCHRIHPVLKMMCWRFRMTMRWKPWKKLCLQTRIGTLPLAMFRDFRCKKMAAKVFQIGPHPFWSFNIWLWLLLPQQRLEHDGKARKIDES